MNGRELVEQLMGEGRYSFTSDEATERLGGTRSAALAAVRRLRDNFAVTSPVRGFWVIVPPEYRSLGCLPAEQFVPELMEFLGLSYYTGLLTAAAYHGAAHQRPQTFQVMTTDPRRTIECGRVKVAFIVRADAADLPVVERNTRTGILQVSSPEATALDLVGYQDRCAGLDNVATILAELGDLLRPDELVEVASAHGPNSWAQRLGYLLEFVGHSLEVRQPSLDADDDISTPGTGDTRLRLRTRFANRCQRRRCHVSSSTACPQTGVAIGRDRCVPVTRATGFSSDPL